MEAAVVTDRELASFIFLAGLPVCSWLRRFSHPISAAILFFSTLLSLFAFGRLHIIAFLCACSMDPPFFAASVLDDAAAISDFDERTVMIFLFTVEEPMILFDT
jgi:hypothetical protein